MSGNEGVSSALGATARSASCYSLPTRVQAVPKTVLKMALGGFPCQSRDSRAVSNAYLRRSGPSYMLT